jgi:hypothetical protein
MSNYYRATQRYTETLYLPRNKTLLEWAMILRDTDADLKKDGTAFAAKNDARIDYEVWKPLEEHEAEFIQFLQATGAELPPLIRIEDSVR